MGSVKTCDLERFGQFHRACLDRGVYLPPSQFEAAFLPATLTDADISVVVEVICEALQASTSR